MESMETEPQLLHLLAPNEAVVAVGVEVRIGEAGGMMNIAMPSIVIKMMRQKFDQQWSLRKTHASPAEQARMLRLLREAALTLETRLEGPTLSVEDLLGMEEGHLLMFDYPVDVPVELMVNGARKFRGQVVSRGKRRACLIEEVLPLPPQPTNKEEETPVSEPAEEDGVDSPQEIQKGPAAAPAIIAIQLQTLEEHQDGKHVGVARTSQAQSLRFLAPKRLNSALQETEDAGSHDVLRHALVIQSAGERAMGADQGGSEPPAGRSPRRPGW